MKYLKKIEDNKLKRYIVTDNKSNMDLYEIVSEDKVIYKLKYLYNYNLEMNVLFKKDSEYIFIMMKDKIDIKFQSDSIEECFEYMLIYPNSRKYNL